MKVKIHAKLLKILPDDQLYVQIPEEQSFTVNKKHCEIIKEKHPIKVEKYNGSLKELVEDLGNLRYDVLCIFIETLSKKIEKDAIKDDKRERKKLASELYHTSWNLLKVKVSLYNAWQICKKFVQEEE